MKDFVEKLKDIKTKFEKRHGISVRYPEKVLDKGDMRIYILHKTDLQQGIVIAFKKISDREEKKKLDNLLSDNWSCLYLSENQFQTIFNELRNIKKDVDYWNLKGRFEIEGG